MKMLRMLVIAMLLIQAGNIAAQSKNQFDRLILLNGQVKEGKVTEMNQTEIRFQYKNESLQYAFRKSEVHRIEFASGRAEIVTEKITPETMALRRDAAENKVAVLPMPFVGEGNPTRMEEMKFRLQEMAIAYYQKQAKELTFLEPAVINAMLRKKEIDDNRLADYTPAELATLLGVEYVIMGNVTQLNGNTTTHNSENSSTQRKINGNGSGIDVKENSHRSGYSSTSENIQTDVVITIFNDKGEKIFGKNRHSLLATPEAYKNALYFLLKKTPVYRR